MLSVPASSGQSLAPPSAALRRWGEKGSDAPSSCSAPLSLWVPRMADREHAPHLKSAENANIQPNPRLILRAEPTVTNILKVRPPPAWVLPTTQSLLLAPSLVAVPDVPARSSEALELPSSFPGSWRSCQAARCSRWCQQPEPSRSPACISPLLRDSPHPCLTPAAAFPPEDVLLLVLLPLPAAALLCAGAAVPHRAWGCRGCPPTLQGALTGWLWQPVSSAPVAGALLLLCNLPSS